MTPIGKPVQGHTAAYRQIIRELIHGLCAVPRDVRLEWIDELHKAGPEGDALPPEDLVVRMVLVNLHVVERVANARREEMRPKLYPIVRDLTDRRGSRGVGNPAGPRPAA